MNDTLTIIIVASVFALVAVRLMRKYNERVKNTPGKGSYSKGKQFAHEDDDEYEPYRSKSGK